jgi:hypothetical protein
MWRQGFKAAAQKLVLKKPNIEVHIVRRHDTLRERPCNVAGDIAKSRGIYDIFVSNTMDFRSRHRPTGVD